MTGSRRVHCYRAPAQGADAGGLGVAVQTLAQYRGLSLMALARDAQPTDRGVPNWMYRIADGTTSQIKTAVLVRLCRALSCDPDALLRLAGLWPTTAIGDRRSAFGDDDAGSDEALLDFRLSEAEDAVACWPDGARASVLRVLEALTPLAEQEQEAPAHVSRGA